MDFQNIIDTMKKGKVGIIGETDEYRKYSVLVPLVKVSGEIHVVFEVRAKKLKVQPGEISFPGGAIENNESPAKAAVRETCEELLIDAKDVAIIGQCDTLITQNNRFVYGFAGIIDNFQISNYSRDEVEHLFTVPLDFFIKKKPDRRKIKILSEPEDGFSLDEQYGIKNYKWIVGKGIVLFYSYENYVIWGLTAKILNNFIDKISGKE